MCILFYFIALKNELQAFDAELSKKMDILRNVSKQSSILKVKSYMTISVFV